MVPVVCFLFYVQFACKTKEAEKHALYLYVVYACTYITLNGHLQNRDFILYLNALLRADFSI